jgi:hypothetical protein
MTIIANVSLPPSQFWAFCVTNVGEAYRSCFEGESMEVKSKVSSFLETGGRCNSSFQVGFITSTYFALAARKCTPNGL